MKYAWDKIEAGPTLTDLLLSPTFRWPMKVKEFCIFQRSACAYPHSTPLSIFFFQPMLSAQALLSLSPSSIERRVST